MPFSEPLLREFDVAKLRPTSPGTLRNWRSKGRGPEWVKVGGSVRYRPSALEAFVDSHACYPIRRRAVA